MPDVRPYDSDFASRWPTLTAMQRTDQRRRVASLRLALAAAHADANRKSAIVAERRKAYDVAYTWNPPATALATNLSNAQVAEEIAAATLGHVRASLCNAVEVFASYPPAE